MRRWLASFTTGTDTQCVETMNPVVQRLTIHAADAHSVRSPHPIENGSQRQETPALVAVSRTRRKTPEAQKPS